MNLKGRVVRLRRDRRRKWRVIKHEGQWVTIVSGTGFEVLRKRVPEWDVRLEA